MSDQKPASHVDRLREMADRLERMRQENQEATDEFSRPGFFTDKLDRGGSGSGGEK